MAKAIKTIGTVVAAVALVATGVGAIAGGAAAAAAGSATAATALSVASYAGLAAGALSVVSAIAFKPSFTQQGSPTKFVTNPQSAIPYAIGRTRQSGIRIYAETWDAFKIEGEQDVIGFGVLLSGGGQIEAIEEFTADGEQITFDSVTGAATTLNYTNWMAQKVWTGGQQSSALAMTFGSKGFQGWTAAHKLSGMTHAIWALRFDKDGKKFAAGVPEPAWIGRWVRVYDPRLDSTYPGGVGPCRPLQETTYVWSRNPALHALTWALGRWQNGKKTFGIGADFENIRVADFVEAANIADTNKWFAGGVEYSTDSKWDIFKRMLQAGGATPTKTGAMIGCRVYAPKVSVTTITRDNLLDGLTFSATKPQRDRINTIVPRYRSEEHEWEVISGAPISVADYVTLDGRIRQKEYDLPLVQHEVGQTDVDGHRQAGQLAAYEIVNAREAGPIQFTTGPQFLGLKAGDCITLNVPEEGFSNTKVQIIEPPKFDPVTGKISFIGETETDSKHAFALGTVAVPPPPFSLTPPDLKPTAPAAANWSVVYSTNNDGLPVAVLSGGTADGVFWDGITVQYKKSSDSTWIEQGTYPDSTNLKVEILVEGGVSYDLRIAYKGAGGYSDWLTFSSYLSDTFNVVVPWSNVSDDGNKPENNATRNVSAGVHSTSSTYAKGDFVRNAAGDATYIAKQNVPAGIALTNTVYWDLFVQGSGAPGENAISAFLTNASHVVSTATDGSGGDYSNAGGTMRVFDGFTEKTSSGTVTYSKVGTGSWYSINSGGVYTITDPGTDSAVCQFDASYSGVTVRLTYSIAKSKTGATGSTGATGPAGTPAVTGYLTNESVTLFAYANGAVISYAPTYGEFKIFSGNTDVSTNFTLSTVSNPQSLNIAYVNRTYQISSGFDTNEDNATITIRATGSGIYSGVTIDKIFTLSKAKGGYEIVNTLPTTDVFSGRVVYLDTDDKLYRYDGTAWTAAVPATDLTGEIVETQIATNAVTADKIAVSAVTANKIAADAITAGKISAGAVTVNKLTVVPVSLQPDPFFQDESFWTKETDWYFESGTWLNAPKYAVLWSGNWSGSLSRTQYLYTSQIDSFPSGQTLRLRATTNNQSNQNLIVTLDYFDKNGSYLSSLAFVSLANSGTNTQSVQGSVPTNAAKMRVVAYNAGGTDFTGAVFVSGITIDVAASADLIVDGAVVANKIAANAVTADKIEAGSITAAKVGTNEIIASSANIKDLTVTTLKVADGAITGIAAAANGSLIWGNGTTQTIITMNVNLAYPGDIIALVTCKQVYTSGTRAWTSQILIDGNQVAFSGGSGGFTDNIAMSGSLNGLSAGNHTVQFVWNGHSSMYIDVGGGNMTTFKRYK